MRQNNVDFQNRQLPTNILALLLVNEQQQREKASGRSRPNWQSVRALLALFVLH
jgi:hypothetical protein